MRKKLEKQDKEWQMFADYYKIYQDFYEPEDNDKYWEALMTASCEFANKYNTEFAKNIMIEYMESRNRIFHLKNA